MPYARIRDSKRIMWASYIPEIKMWAVFSGKPSSEHIRGSIARIITDGFFHAHYEEVLTKEESDAVLGDDWTGDGATGRPRVDSADLPFDI